jgi:hypothetical protein
VEIVKEYSSSNKWVDHDFYRNSTYFGVFTSTLTKNNFLSKFGNGINDYYYARLTQQYPSGNIFDSNGDATWLQPIQGGAGTCYFMQALSGVGEFPELIKRAFLI